MRLSLRAGVAALALAALCTAPSPWSLVAAAADSPVADAAVRGDVEAVRALLERGADVQTARPDGMTALHWAAMHGDVEMAGMLLYAGANLEATTRIGHHTPLHVAARSGRAEVVQACSTPAPIRMPRPRAGRPRCTWPPRPGTPRPSPPSSTTGPT